VAQLLAHNPALIDAVASDNNTALHLAASGGHVKVVAELLAQRPSFLADENGRGRTPLFCAASAGHQEVVDLFPLTTDQVFVPPLHLFVFVKILVACTLTQDSAYIFISPLPLSLLFFSSLLFSLYLSSFF